MDNNLVNDEMNAAPQKPYRNPGKAIAALVTGIGSIISGLCATGWGIYEITNFLDSFRNWTDDNMGLSTMLKVFSAMYLFIIGYALSIIAISTGIISLVFGVRFAKLYNEPNNKLVLVGRILAAIGLIAGGFGGYSTFLIIASIK